MSRGTAKPATALCVTALACASLLASCGGSATSRADRTAGASYLPIHAERAPGLVIDATDCGVDTPLILYAYRSPHSTGFCGAHQLWMFHRVSNGYDSIFATYGDRSECMTVTGVRYRPGSAVWARPCDPSKPLGSQQFRAAGGNRRGRYQLVAAVDRRLCIGVAGTVAPDRELVLSRCGIPGSHWSIAAAPAHTETWALDDSATSSGCNGGYGASQELVRAWLTYAETNCGPANAKALNDCHAGRVAYCTVFQYLDASKVWTGNPVRTAPWRENWWLHEPGYGDAAHRLTDTSAAYGTAYWLNQANPAVQKWVARYVRSDYDLWDGLMMDLTAASVQGQFYRPDVPRGRQYSSSAELPTDRAIVAAHEALAAVLRHSDGTPFIQVDNGVDPNPRLPNTLPLLNHPPGVVGLISEGRPWDRGFSPYFSGLLDVLAAADATRDDFVVLLSYGRGGSSQARRVQEATVLLGYAPGHVVSWADLEQDNLDLSVWPEEGIYPTGPVESMSVPDGAGCLAGRGALCAVGGHNDLRVAAGSNVADPGAGVYRREFRACYDRGVWFGRCAVVVNDTSSAVVVRGSWLRQSYRHLIVMRDGDVQSGGSLDLTGGSFVPDATKLHADDAILLAQ